MDGMLTLCHLSLSEKFIFWYFSLPFSIFYPRQSTSVKYFSLTSFLDLFIILDSKPDPRREYETIQCLSYISFFKSKSLKAQCRAHLSGSLDKGWTMERLDNVM